MAEQPLAAGSRSLRCLVVTPEATVLDREASFITVPLFDGEAGILPGKSPMVGRLGYGELRLKTDSGEERYYVDGGFVQVQDNVVSILTGKSIPEAQIDVVAAQRQLDEAIAMKATTAEELAIRERLMNQGRGQLRLAERSKAKH